MKQSYLLCVLNAEDASELQGYRAAIRRWAPQMKHPVVRKVATELGVVCNAVCEDPELLVEIQVFDVEGLVTEAEMESVSDTVVTDEYNTKTYYAFNFEEAKAKEVRFLTPCENWPRPSPRERKRRRK